MSLGLAAGTSKPMPASTSTLSGVAIATWAASTPSMAATSRLTWRSATESAYAPERSSTCDFVGGLMRHSPSRGSRGRAARPTTARRRTCARSPSGPGRRRPRPACRGRRRTPRTPAAPRRAGRSRAGWPRAGWSGREWPRTAAVTSSVRRSVATSTASQPQRTSSPRGVRPPPLPTSPCSTGLGQSICGRREGWRAASPPAAGRGGRASAIVGLAARRTLPRSIRGTRTSTNRPTRRGLPARYRVPRST